MLILGLKGLTDVYQLPLASQQCNNTKYLGYIPSPEKTQGSSNKGTFWNFFGDCLELQGITKKFHLYISRKI